MNLRLLIMTILGLLIVAGLAAGVFAGSIQRALTVSAHPSGAQNAQIALPAATPSPGQTATPQANMPGQMPATTLASDTFQRQNQQLWGTASDGRNWEGDANDPAASPVFSIANKIGIITGSARQQGTFNALLGPTNIYNVDAMLNGSINRFTGTTNLGVVVRWADKTHWYKAFIDGTRLTLIKRANTVSGTLSSVPFKAQPGVSYSLRLRAVGGTLFTRAWRSDTPEPTTWMITVSDPDLTTGQAGVRVLLQSGTVVKVFSFQATTASSTM